MRIGTSLDFACPVYPSRRVYPQRGRRTRPSSLPKASKSWVPWSGAARKRAFVSPAP
jgi:hypothetical protein